MPELGELGITGRIGPLIGLPTRIHLGHGVSEACRANHQHSADIPR